ncbi:MULTISPECIES: 2-amino-4-hydroxy-6-hydroxymethyldihydropteridine diphosphokinase [Falsihalocynthiibacter]|uniref:2-amino-4-hydroxy-6- hydroxymethyldihydropteridine diphosphokinase n=1 Tax=Falsihalocynthiibacter TaxID=2854182 RepID=UPI003001B51A
MPQPTECHNAETIGIVSLGSNVITPQFQPLERLRRALVDLGDVGITLKKTSQFYHSPFFPANQGADFVNAVAVVSGPLIAREVLSRLHAIEAKHDRTRESRWADRTLDIDLIAWGDGIQPDVETFSYWRDLPMERQKALTPDQLILPHPRLQDRAFVLVPLNDVFPTWKHPVTGESVAEMLNALSESEKSAIIPLRT